ncbi:DNA-3-methyladenine glycosylase I [Immundisolibacter sp.]|uniref:DNA-3-methyladenine glycosylase I n=1 Tax=Immundisolibacter sp. TaxID=1934948 RepID=UPI003565CC93
MTLTDPKALADLYRRIARTCAALDVEQPAGVPDPATWAIAPRHDDDRLLFEELCFHMFAAGFSREVVRQKWPATREAFAGFDIPTLAGWPPARLQPLFEDRRLIRNRRKIEAVVHNAGVVQALAIEHGSFAAWLHGYPADQLHRLHRELARRFASVGPSAGEWFLLTSGFPYYFRTDHAQRLLRRLGLLSARPRPDDFDTVMQALHAATGVSRWAISAQMFRFASGFRLREGICQEAPRCPKCPLWDHCDHFNQSDTL